MGCSGSHNNIVPVLQTAGEEELKIVFTKVSGAGLGLRAKPNKDGEAVVFQIVDGGMINLWNHRNPASKVTKGDRIISVNGVSNFWPMMFELQCTGTHHIVVRRGSLDDFAAPTASAGKETTKAVTADLVKSLPRVSAAECTDKECSICLDNLSEAYTNVKLPCGHCFHLECAENWLTKGKGRCPLCAAPVDAESVTMSQQCADTGNQCSCVSENSLSPSESPRGERSSQLPSSVASSPRLKMRSKRIAAPNHEPLSDDPLRCTARPSVTAQGPEEIGLLAPTPLVPATNTEGQQSSTTCSI